ncbi:MAG: hypothetical protein LVS60_06645 [Nodosilinea sp. LVE1205-7]
MSSGQIKALLEQKRSAFSYFNRASSDLLKTYQQAWVDFARLDYPQRQDLLAPLTSPVGAQPLEMAADADQGIISFSSQNQLPLENDGPTGRRAPNGCRKF